MREKITLGISPCPNDTFMFYALLNKKTSFPWDLHVVIRDVEELNQMVYQGELSISKVSYHMAGLVRDRYGILDVGSALGWGCGPLVVTKREAKVHSLVDRRIAIPGQFTTAHMLLRLYEPRVGETVPMLFSEIPQAVLGGQFAAGLIIHETRFTHEGMGLKTVVDLGRWWEESYGLPIPLGGIVYDRGLAPEVVREFAHALRSSISYAWEHTDEVLPFMKKWARELDESVILNHVRLYVNDFSLDLGETGKKAVDFLFQLGIERGLFPKEKRDLS